MHPRGARAACATHGSRRNDCLAFSSEPQSCHEPDSREAHVLSPKLYRFLAPVRRVLRRGNSISRDEPGKNLLHLHSVTKSFFLSLEIQNMHVPKLPFPGPDPMAELAKRCKQVDVPLPPRRPSMPPRRSRVSYRLRLQIFGRRMTSRRALYRHDFSARPLFFAVAPPFNERASL